uniref:Putative ovule protein n=1 Tax=Solanum chacoense TaxID=4108 RepID=A0A0V0GQU3_SOLCH
MVCHLPMVRSSSSNPIHTCLGLALVKSTWTFTLAMLALVLLMEVVSRYKTLPIGDKRGVINSFLKQCHGNPGRSIHIGTMGVSSSGLKFGVQVCILISLPSIVILCCVHTVLQSSSFSKSINACLAL